MRQAGKLAKFLIASAVIASLAAISSADPVGATSGTLAYPLLKFRGRAVSFYSPCMDCGTGWYVDLTQVVSGPQVSGRILVFMDGTIAGPCTPGGQMEWGLRTGDLVEAYGEFRLSLSGDHSLSLCGSDSYYLRLVSPAETPTQTPTATSAPTPTPTPTEIWPAVPTPTRTPIFPEREFIGTAVEQVPAWEGESAPLNWWVRVTWAPPGWVPPLYVLVDVNPWPVFCFDGPCGGDCLGEVDQDVAPGDEVEVLGFDLCPWEAPCISVCNDEEHYFRRTTPHHDIYLPLIMRRS